jgi:hypothetical protein
MPRETLTDLIVEELKPPAPGKYVNFYDTVMHGLVLRTNYGGKKTWHVLFYVPGVAKTGKRAGQRTSMPTTHKLGTFPILTLEEARERCRQFLANPQAAQNHVKPVKPQTARRYAWFAARCARDPEYAERTKARDKARSVRERALLRAFKKIQKTTTTTTQGKEYIP